MDIVDVATGALSNGTSQPSMTALYYALQNNPRQPKLDIEALETIDRYWQGIRPYYAAGSLPHVCQSEYDVWRYYQSNAVVQSGR